MEKHEKVLNFWFGNVDKESAPDQEKYKLWFEKNDVTDKKIKDNFMNDIESALNNLYDNWQERSESALALVLILDQFTRNVFRGSPKSFEGDNKALQVSLIAIDKGFDKLFHPKKSIFFYLPFEHSENIDMQNKCLSLFDELIENSHIDLRKDLLGFKDYAQKHKAIIENFGRFPHRNEVLNRISSSEEIEFLQQPNSSF